MRGLTLLALVTGAAIFSGCGMFNLHEPMFAANDFGAVKWEEWGSHLQGDRWQSETYNVIHDASRIEAETVEGRMDDLVPEITKSAYRTLSDLQARGALFKVRATSSGRLLIDVQQPAAGSGLTGNAIADSALGAVVRVPVFGDKGAIKSAETSLGAIGYQLTTLRNDELGNADDRFYGAVRRVQEIERESPSEIPDGVTVEDYKKLLRVLVLRVDADHRELEGFEAELVALRAAAASIDSSQGGSVANMLVVLDAAAVDRKEVTRVRAELAKYPPQKEKLDALVKQGDDLVKATLASDGYKKWESSPHAVRKTKRFASDVNEGLKATSSLGSMMGQPDVVGDAEDAAADATRIDVKALCVEAMKLAPAGSKLRGVLDTAQKTYAKAEQVRAVVNDPRGAAEKQLLTWATPQEVTDAQSRLQAAGVLR